VLDKNYILEKNGKEKIVLREIALTILKGECRIGSIDSRSITGNLQDRSAVAGKPFAERSYKHQCIHCLEGVILKSNFYGTGYARLGLLSGLSLTLKKVEYRIMLKEGCDLNEAYQDNY
jgi:hypothetical protein